MGGKERKEKKEHLQQVSQLSKKYLEGHFVIKKKEGGLSVRHKGRNQDNKLILP